MSKLRVALALAIIAVLFLVTWEAPLASVHNTICLAVIVFVAYAMKEDGKNEECEDDGLERVSEVRVCNSAEEANQYLALGPEWDLKDSYPNDSDVPGTDRIIFVIARWETAQDRDRLRRRDQNGTRES